MSRSVAGDQRLQKVLSRAGVSSRRGGEDLIRAGRVTVNGEVAELGRKVGDDDVIKVDGKRVVLPTRKRYVLLNKPTGYLTTRSDPEGRPTVFDLLPASMRRQLKPVGRLDFDTEGLILLTDDGDLAQRISHPSQGCGKSYEVKLKGRPEPASVQKLRDGIVLNGRRTRPAKIEAMDRQRGRRALESNSWWRVEIREGRTRQIREMFDRVGHSVLRLRRVAIGKLADKRLPRGSFRELSEHEVHLLATSGGKPPGSR